MPQSWHKWPQNLATNRLYRSEVIWVGIPKRFTHPSKNRRAVSEAVSVFFAGIRATNPDSVSVMPIIELYPSAVMGRVSTQSMVICEHLSGAMGRDFN